MTSNEYLLLFEKFLSGEASAEEIEMIMAYRDKFEMSNRAIEGHHLYEQVKRRVQDKLELSIKSTIKRKNNFRIWLSTAAALIIFSVAFSCYFLNSSSPEHQKTASNVAKYQNDILSPGSQATLTLGNGNTVSLKYINSNTSLKQKAGVIKSNGKGIIQYFTSGSKIQAAAPEINSISTDTGGQYAVILSDGTKVWLNAASTLTYPTVFTGNERKVHLTGEAYFEVAKDKSKPFKVEFNKQIVEVLGTHFNVMAYSDESYNSATLLEGSIKISNNSVSKVIAPGEQATTINGKNDINVHQANLEEVMSWKQGYFLFKNENIQTIMRKVARWYNVDVQYQGNLQNQVYGGRIASSKSLTEILNNLELTGTIHFKIEGRRITVME